MKEHLVEHPKIGKETIIGKKYRELLKEFGLRTGKPDNNF